MKLHADTCTCSQCEVPKITANSLRMAYNVGVIHTKVALEAIFGQEFFRPDEESFSMGECVEIEGGVFMIASTGVYCKKALINITSGELWGQFF